MLITRRDCDVADDADADDDNDDDDVAGVETRDEGHHRRDVSKWANTRDVKQGNGATPQT